MTPLLGRVNKFVFSSQIEGFLSLINSKQYLQPWFITVRNFSFNDDRGGAREYPSFNDNGSNRSDKAFDIQQSSSESGPSRSFRGQKQINQTPLNSQEYSRGGRSVRPRFDDRRGSKSSQIDLGFQGRNVAEVSRDAGQLGDSFLDKFKLGFDDKVGNHSEVESNGQTEGSRASDTDQPAQEPMPQDADEIFKKMKETGLIPNAVAMLDGLCKDGNVQEALKLFGLMREKGTIPEIVIYTAVVEGYTKAHKADDAIRIFRKMQSNGISPNAYSFTVLIQGLYKCSRLQDALEFCVEMLEAGYSLNVTTFVGVVDGFCKEDGVEEAKGVIKTLTEKGFAYDEKAVREFLDKKAPFSPSIWEAVFGKKVSQRPF
ncbi:uncharacterized protein [Cicer arietinum]|uniref:Pentatricopeptide repeat-containing protein At4g38150 isoform X1 n=1 Tax=Cicer arietinum TaxID=3827 RepID=A0A1S2YYP8_CICAR|nr:pentatricopeptide repeat-containing protein At4g38150 isoform X1 [Cicer arietinum]XP_012574404.1 pentatricopeptide repeat-containing protein At4g38150 isoform X1 [Cicer arietinum]